MKPPLLLPEPQKTELGEGECTLPPIPLGVRTDFEPRLAALPFKKDADGFVHVQMDSSLATQAYRLSVKKNAITINCADIFGLRYALITLGQLINQYGKAIPCLEIEDFPHFEKRGVMLDISRDRVYTMDHLFKTVDKDHPALCEKRGKAASFNQALLFFQHGVLAEGWH